MPRLILCADDFAFSPEVSETIVELAQAGKLNATSCMTLEPGWPEDAMLLRDVPTGFQVGIHLVLTGERPITDMPKLAPHGRLPDINPLHRLASRKELDLAEVEGELKAQFDRFEEAMGRAPDFVDGHQHCHALPGVREIVLAETARRAPTAWVRNCVDSVGAMAARPFFGKAIGSAFHSRGLAKAAAAHGLTCNDSFAGHYTFAGDYAAIFPKFLRKPGAMHLVMCHPGSGMRDHDGIAAARLREAADLRTLAVVDLAAAQGLSFPG